MACVQCDDGVRSHCGHQKGIYVRRQDLHCTVARLPVHSKTLKNLNFRESTGESNYAIYTNIETSPKTKHYFSLTCIGSRKRLRTHAPAQCTIKGSTCRSSNLESPTVLSSCNHLPSPLSGSKLIPVPTGETVVIIV